MTEPAHALERSWFVAALSSDITSRPLSVLLFGQPMVLVRSGDRVWAMEDRCPHRGVPLSAGCLTAKGLECPYHGWTFGADGVCTDMPGWAEAPLREVRVPAFTVIERDGLVWVSASHRGPLPERITSLDPSRQRFLSQSIWPAPVLDVQQNFLEALPAQNRATLSVERDGFVIDYVGQSQSPLLRLFESRRVSQKAWYAALGVTQLEYRHANGAATRITLCFTPRDDQQTRVFAMVHVEGRWAPRWLVSRTVSPLLHRVASQGAPDFARPYLMAAWEGRLATLPAQVTRGILV